MKYLFIVMLIGCGGSAPPTRAQIEADTDKFCAAVAKVRAIEKDYGLEPDAGIGGGK